MPDLVIVGAGRMGANHVRTARALREWESVVVVDQDAAKARALAQTNGFRHATRLDQVIGAVDAAILAVPDPLHEEYAVQALEAGLHVLVEKPLAQDLPAATRIAEAAAGREGHLLVGHIERFNAAVAEVLRYAGQVQHVEFRRVGPPGGRALGDVVSDLMVHDLDLFLAMLGPDADIDRVQAMWAGPEAEMCTALLGTRDGVCATLVASRMSQAKLRSIIVTAEGVQVVADLVRQSVSIFRIDHDEFVDEGGTTRYRQRGTTEIPFLQQGEPLLAEQRHFAAVVAGEARPLISAQDAIRALELVDRVRTAAGPQHPDAAPTAAG